MKRWCNALVAVPQVPGLRTTTTITGTRTRIAAPTYAKKIFSIADPANKAKDNNNKKGVGTTMEGDLLEAKA